MAPETAAILAGGAAFIGHCFPVWLKFRGGKGVATLLGIALAASPLAGLIALLVWLGGAVATRYSSVGGMLAAASVPVSMAAMGLLGWAATTAVLAAVLIARHHENIARLRAGTESRIGAK